MWLSAVERFGSCPSILAIPVSPARGTRSHNLSRGCHNCELIIGSKQWRRGGDDGNRNQNGPISAGCWREMAGDEPNTKGWAIRVFILLLINTWLVLEETLERFYLVTQNQD
ncbi:hypothetical protein BJX70DRAFT_250352 [Aspergillus crustosus]